MSRKYLIPKGKYEIDGKYYDIKQSYKDNADSKAQIAEKYEITITESKVDNPSDLQNYKHFASLKKIVLSKEETEKQFSMSIDDFVKQEEQLLTAQTKEIVSDTNQIKTETAKLSSISTKSGNEPIVKAISKSVNLTKTTPKTNNSQLADELIKASNTIQSFEETKTMIDQKYINQFRKLDENVINLKKKLDSTVKDINFDNLKGGYYLGDEKKYDTVSSRLKDMIASVYKSATPKSEYQKRRYQGFYSEAVRGVRRNKDNTSKGDYTGAEEVLSKGFTKLDLEYSSKEIQDKLEQSFAKYKQENPTNSVELVDYVHELRQKDSELDKQLLETRTKIKQTADQLFQAKAEARAKELKEVTSILHAGMQVSQGSKGKGGADAKITTQPILFKSKDDEIDFFKKINKIHSGETDEAYTERIKQQYGKLTVPFDRETVQKVYGNWGTTDNLSNNIYGIPNDYYEDPEQRLYRRKITGLNSYQGELDINTATEKLVSALQKGAELVANKTSETIEKQTSETAKVEARKKSTEKPSVTITKPEEETEEEKLLKAKKKAVDDRVNSKLAAFTSLKEPIAGNFDEENDSLKSIVSLYELKKKAMRENIDLMSVVEQGLKGQKLLLEDIKSLDEQITNIEQTGIELKREYVNVLASDKATAEEKKYALEQRKLIEDNIDDKIRPLRSIRYRKQEDFNANKNLVQETVNTILEKHGYDPKTGKQTNAGMPQAMLSSKGEMYFTMGAGGSGGGGDKTNVISDVNTALQKVMMNVGMAKGILNTVVAPVAYYVEQVRELETAIFDLGVVGQKSINEIRSLRNEFIDMAASSRYSAVELTRSTSEIIRVGRSYDEARQILAASERLATASFEELGKATDAVVKAMTAFDLSAESAAHVANSFHNIANTTPLSLQTFDESLRQTAAAFGAIVYFSSKSGSELEEYKKQVLDTTAVLTGLQSVLGRTGSQAKVLV